jgi:hypothetical protein
MTVAVLFIPAVLCLASAKKRMIYIADTCVSSIQQYGPSSTKENVSPTWKRWKEDPRWWLRHRSRQCELCESKILLRHWTTLSGNKTPRRIKTSAPEPLACRKLLQPHYTEKTRGFPPPPDAGSKPAWETFGRPTSEPQESWQYSPGINQHSPWADWHPLPPPTPQKKWINNNLKTSTQQRGWDTESTPEKWGGARSWSPLELSINKGWKSRRADSRPVISCFLK